MSLPVTNININYEEEKGKSLITWSLFCTDIILGKIKTFLEKFEGRKDVTLGMADLDIQDGDMNPLNRLKYMSQLVSRVLLWKLETNYSIAKNCKSGATNANH